MAMTRFFGTPKLRRRKKLHVELLEDRQLLALLTVNTTADDTSADSTLSLREAIEVSSGSLAVSSLSSQEQAQVSGPVGATNTIDFNIPMTDPGYNAATGVWTIAVNSDLPKLTKNAAIINGYSQPDSSKNTLAQGDNAKLAIAISSTSSFAAYGLTIDQPGSQVSGLDIENFSGAGVLVTAGGNTQVTGCFIGTDPSGEIAAPNGAGVTIENSLNTIGGPDAADRNVISGNNGSGTGGGVILPSKQFNPLGLTPTGNLIENNYIGVDASGTKALANLVGVSDNGSDNTYGGTLAGAGNVISGNSFGGIKSFGSIAIEGNLIGTDATGNVALGNGNTGNGISNEQLSPGTYTYVISNNIISGNNDGMSLMMMPGNQSTYTIDQNFIGTNASGTAALGNTGVGIDLYEVENATLKNNVISANSEGVRFGYSTIMSPPVQNDVMQGNLIGTDKTGLVPLGNKFNGVSIDSGTGITVGGTGTGEANVIAFNGQDGIDLADGEQDNFAHNSIFGNGDAGIYLTWQTNQSATPPVLAATPGPASNGTITGTLAAKPDTTYTVDIYSSLLAPAAGKEQGETFVQEVMVTTDGTGKGTFSVTEPAGYYTAMDTDPIGDSSAFSNAVGIVSLPSTVTTISSSANPSTLGEQVSFTAVVTAPSYQGTPTGMVTFTIDGQPQTPVSLSVIGGVDEAQFSTSTLTAGQHSVTAAYSGDNNVGPSSGSLPTQTVNPPDLVPTTTTLTSSLNPETVGQQVTFKAVVSAQGFQGTPTGTVTFTIDGQAQPPVSLSVQGGQGEAQFVTSTLTTGRHTVTATYSGDSNVAPSSGSLPTQTVNRPSLQLTTTTLASSLDPTTVGQQVTFTAVVSPGAYLGTPTGTVTFSIDGTPQTPVSLKLVEGSELATFSIATLTAGSHRISATYSGDTTFAPSAVKSSLIQTVKADAPPAIDGPTVVSVKRFGVHMHPTVLVLSFQDALDPTSAQDVRNYKIVGPGGQAIRIASATFDRVANTVTLRPATRISIHRPYHLTLIGTGATGLTNAEGILLDGAKNGLPGSNYQATLTWRNLVMTPAEVKKYDHPKPVKLAGALTRRSLLTTAEAKKSTRSAASPSSEL
jgi:hypothetical protein